jgi:predicted metal-dependent hydrolase
MEYDISIVTILIGIGIYLIYDTYILGAREYVTSTIDERKYLVRSLPDKQEAADLLAETSEELHKLIKHMEKMNPKDPRTERLVINFNRDSICEGVDSNEYTSYSVNKGEQIIFCLRQKDKNNTLVDLNTILFVGIHELAHLCTVSIGHTDEFWENFRWLLQEAIQIGVYTEQDYKSKPQKYCGINITSSPLD